MDIDLLSKMVKELILDEDRVVLPGFGCFVAEIVPASFSDKGYTVNPPYRKLYFRSRPDEGTALVEFYAKSNGVEYAMAERIIHDFLAELKSVIYVRKTVVFPGLGRLRATKENNLFFVADEDLDIYPAGYGLAPVSLKTHRETKEEVSAAVVGLKDILSGGSSAVQEDTSEEVLESIFEPLAEADSGVMADPDGGSGADITAGPESESAQDQESHAESAAVEPAPATEEVNTEEPSAEEPSAEEVKAPAAEAAAEAAAAAAEEEEGQDQQTAVEEPASESAEESVEESVDEPASESAEESAEVPEVAADGAKSRKVLKVIAILLLAVVLLLVAYMAVGRLCPEWIDRFLYSPEEMEILKR